MLQAHVWPPRLQEGVVVPGIPEPLASQLPFHSRSLSHPSSGQPSSLRGRGGPQSGGCGTEQVASPKSALFPLRPLIRWTLYLEQDPNCLSPSPLASIPWEGRPVVLRLWVPWVPSCSPHWVPWAFLPGLSGRSGPPRFKRIWDHRSSHLQILSAFTHSLQIWKGGAIILLISGTSALNHHQLWSHHHGQGVSGCARYPQIIWLAG